MKLTSILIILLFAFTLVACGGGGSSRVPDVPPTGPTAEEMAAATAAMTAATEAATEATKAATAANDAVSAAMLVTDTMAASDAAAAATAAATKATAAAAAVVAADAATVTAATDAAKAANDAAMAANAAATALNMAESDAQAARMAQMDAESAMSAATAAAMKATAAAAEAQAAVTAATLADSAAAQAAADAATAAATKATAAAAAVVAADAATVTAATDAAKAANDAAMAANAAATALNMAESDAQAARMAQMDAESAMSAATAAAMKATAAAAEAQAAVTAATLADSAAAQAAADAATAAATKATAAAAAVVAGDEATVTAANEAADEAEAAAEAAMMAASALTMAEAEAVRIDAEDKAAAAVVAATKAAATKRTAIDKENDQTTAQDAGLGGTGATTVTMAIERDRDGTTVKITDSGLAGDDDPKYEQRMDLRGGTTMHSRIMEANDDGDVVEEVVIVSTDIQAPKATAFATVHELNISTTDPTETSEALAVADTPVARDLVMSSEFSANTAAVLTFAFDDGATDADEAFETPGTYDGAMGTYRCNGDAAACTVTIGDADTTMDGVQLGITDMSAGWIFTPNRGVTVDVVDADYLHYGVWLKKTTDEDGVVTYNEVETFAGSSVDASGDITTVRGTATYSGGATGVYEHQLLNPDGSEASATSGHFTADASLTAHFAQTVSGDPGVPTGCTECGIIAPSMLNSLSGTIDNFLLSGHDQGPGWSVSLQGDITPADGDVSGTAKGGGKYGKYSATFHGPIADTDGDPIQPHTVVGEFGAFFKNGSVAGGFGARKNNE